MHRSMQPTEEPQRPVSFTREELNRKVTALRREAIEFETMVREGRRDPDEPAPEIIDERDNGNERIRRAIAFHRKVPDFDVGLKRLADAKEARLKLQTECEAIRERIGSCLMNPIFDGVEEDDRIEDEQFLHDSLPAKVHLDMRAQLLLEDDAANDSDDERAVAAYKDALKEVMQLDSEFLAYAGDAQAEQGLSTTPPCK